MRKYRCYYYINGDEDGEFEFYSIYRAGSKANKEDALEYYRRKHGHTNIEIVQIYLIGGEF